MAKYKRRKYFIDRQLQSKYILLTILLLLVYTLLFIAILFMPHIVPLAFNYPAEEQTKAARMLLSLHGSVWPGLGLVIVIMSSLSIFITHKIAGPVYRFKQALAEIAGGNLNVSVNLRRKDDLKDLAEDMNKVVEELRDFMTTLQKDHRTMSECITELEEQIFSNQISKESGMELIEKLKESRGSIADTLSKYPPSE